MDVIVGQLDGVVDVMGKVWDIISTNPLLQTFVAIGLLGIAIGLFSAIKNAAR